MHLSAGAQACVVAFSMVDRDSFDAVKNWLRKVNASHYNLIKINHNACNDVSDTFHLSAHDDLSNDLSGIILQ